jgi:hypothetical protein
MSNISEVIRTNLKDFEKIVSDIEITECRGLCRLMNSLPGIAVIHQSNGLTGMLFTFNADPSQKGLLILADLLARTSYRRANWRLEIVPQKSFPNLSFSIIGPTDDCKGVESLSIEIEAIQQNIFKYYNILTDPDNLYLDYARANNDRNPDEFDLITVESRRLRGISQLKEKYSNTENKEHPTFIRLHWRIAVFRFAITQGYWEWVYDQIEFATHLSLVENQSC